MGRIRPLNIGGHLLGPLLSCSVIHEVPGTASLDMSHDAAGVIFLTLAPSSTTDEDDRLGRPHTHSAASPSLLECRNRRVDSQRWNSLPKLRMTLPGSGPDRTQTSTCETGSVNGQKGAGDLVKGTTGSQPWHFAADAPLPGPKTAASMRTPATTIQKSVALEEP
jgi:hypothetical protein